MIGWLLVIGGITLAIADASKLIAEPMTPRWEIGTQVLSQTIAATAGIFLLRGRSWARWLAIAWMGTHVGISLLHSAAEVAVHATLLAAMCWFLLRRPAREWFRA